MRFDALSFANVPHFHGQCATLGTISFHLANLNHRCLNPPSSSDCCLPCKLLISCLAPTHFPITLQFNTQCIEPVAVYKTWRPRNDLTLNILFIISTAWSNSSAFDSSFGPICRCSNSSMAKVYLSISAALNYFARISLQNKAVTSIFAVL